MKQQGQDMNEVGTRIVIADIVYLKEQETLKNHMI
jgi:hypothetical protein